MFVKAHSSEFCEEFGFLSTDQSYIRFMDGSRVNISKRLELSPVVRVNARWMDKDIKIRCEVADTLEKKRTGLQEKSALEDDEGMYFPYSDYTDVVFHQGRVPFSLDLVFLKDFKVARMEEMTEVGSFDRWGCLDCDGVIEVQGGFCKMNEVENNDPILISAVSVKDLEELKRERMRDSLMLKAGENSPLMAGVM